MLRRSARGARRACGRASAQRLVESARTGSSPYSPRVAKSIIRSTASASRAVSVCLRIEHGFESTAALGRLSRFCNAVLHPSPVHAALQGSCWPAKPRTSAAVRAGFSTLGEWPAPAIRLVSAPGYAVGVWRARAAGSSMICSSAPMITSSGLPVACIRSVERLFADVVLDVRWASRRRRCRSSA